MVDDNRITATLLARYLEANGYEAGKAHDGVDCLEKILERVPDTIIMDVMMPRMDGYTCVQEIRKRPEWSQIPVVMITAIGDVANHIAAIERGADDVITKPIEEKILIAKVKLLTRIPKGC